jgi:hypothetical protein
VIWAILAFLGVPLWVCAAGILVILVNNRRLRTRYGDIPVRVSDRARSGGPEHTESGYRTCSRGGVAQPHGARTLSK